LPPSQTTQNESSPDGNLPETAREESWDEFRRRRRSKMTLPTCLFIATCLSTFWVGVSDWSPMEPVERMFEPGSVARLMELLVQNWQQGLIYTGCVLAILMTHELGHFIATIIYRIPATAPLFIPFPFNPIGTLGAVIAMDSNTANRRQIFDIGIAGPLAGMAVAIPIAIVGIMNLDLSETGQGTLGYKCPLAFQWMMQWFGTPGYTVGEAVWINQLNPYFAAAWVGFLITGLNMFPVGQLDGGHVTYTLFGRFSHWIANGTMVLWIAFMVAFDSYILILMVVLILVVGTKHPPTADDRVKLGWFRTGLGLASLSIPFLCFPPGIFELSFPSLF